MRNKTEGVIRLFCRHGFVVAITVTFAGNTVEPPVSDHLKCKHLVVAYGRWSLTRIEPGHLFQEEVRAHLLYGRWFICMQFLSKAMCISVLSRLKFSANIEIRECFKWSLSRKRLKTMENHKIFRPKRWSRSLSGGGRLLEVSIVRLWLGKFWCFGLAVAYGRWSLTRDCRTWPYLEIACI